ncbi:TatD family hydrolase [Sphingobacterium humi]|uniref:YchF/TatD family DNA exonuclease n=1 Tax=Sphingobacterium humi TaxID=1796905 RepID=A0A6N8L4X6_9SPHI|nr:TatD family hydrolase [Sphingobacterium humi]MVZ64079.1 YchF/TatD family DNA exonuclease [Sphingobacterium humi]
MEEQIDAQGLILTDTHTHIYYHQEAGTLDQQMQRCFANGVQRLFLPNVDVASIVPVLDTAAAYPTHCFPMLGLHPCSVQEDYLEALASIKAAIAKHKIYAIGEIGIDLYWDKSTLAIQQDAFAQQIEWAKEMGLPISIHCREAFDEVFEVLDQHKDERLFGVFHCFTGNVAQAQRAIALGFKLGIGGVVTFKKAGLDAVLKDIDLAHLVLETDAPYLAPVPFRGKENESSYLLYVAQKVADIYEKPLAEIAEVTTANSKALFSI